MFNGIIFNQGILKKITKRKKGINIFVNSDLKLTKKDINVYQVYQTIQMVIWLQ